MTYKTKRSILISNYLSLILTGAIFAISTFRLTLYKSNEVDIHWIIGTITFVLPIILNRLLLTTVGRLVLCFCPIFFIWYSFIDNMYNAAALEVSQFDGIRVFLLGISFVPYVLFDRTQLGLLALGILPSLISVLFFDFWLDLAQLNISDHLTVGVDYRVMWMRTLISYLVISAGCIAFQSIITYNDRLTEMLLVKVKKNF